MVPGRDSILCRTISHEQGVFPHPPALLISSTGNRAHVCLQAASEKSVRTSASSAFTYQSQAPGRRTALDGPVTFNKGSGQPWK